MERPRSPSRVDSPSVALSAGLPFLAYTLERLPALLLVDEPSIFGVSFGPVSVEGILDLRTMLHFANSMSVARLPVLRHLNNSSVAISWASPAEAVTLLMSQVVGSAGQDQPAPLLVRASLRPIASEDA
jgi:hypothetical protein